MSLPFHEARSLVLHEVQSLRAARATEVLPLDEAAWRILAEPVLADRDQPPFDRVTRDGFAVRSADVAGATSEPVRLQVIGEAPPGKEFSGQVGPGQCVEIMTGAPLPAGCDAVVMVEYSECIAAELVVLRRAVSAGQNVVPRASELRQGAECFAAGQRLDEAAIALLASVGCARPRVVVRPTVAIIATGDELVGIEETPAPAQIRNSNRHALAACVARAGGQALALPIGRDDPKALRALAQQALAQADVLLLSGGVSMGKYDFVEQVLADLGARTVFDGVDIRPGRPLVFGTVQGKPFFGLPGNPVSTLVTFRLFVEPALQVLAGAAAPDFRCTYGRLAADYAQPKVGLTVFSPAALQTQDRAPTMVRPLPSQGSADLAALARADCWMVVAPGVTEIPAGTWVPVVPK